MKFPKFGGIKQFFARLVQSARLMTKTEHILLYILIGLISFGVLFKGYGLYLNNTVVMPTSGGVYKEATIGTIKYLNPIFAKTDAERSVSRLLYSGLVKLDEKGNVAPDLAQKWEISPDGLDYKFYLRNEVYFHNGEKLSAQDVVNTINAIKNPDLKSPYQNIWSEVNVSALDNNTVEMKIPRQNGAFIFNCLQGIMASDNLASTSLTENINGTGPYRLKVLQDMKGGYTYVELEKYNFYYSNPALISDIQISSYPDNFPAEVTDQPKNFTAISAAPVSDNQFLNESFKVGRALVLISNLKNAFLADDSNRTKVMKFEKLDSKTKLKLLALDGAKQREKIGELKEKYKGTNVDLDIQVLSSVEYYKKLQARDFDLVLYGIDYGPDRDPYAMWHTSQIGEDNLASYANKAMDIKLEDARMILDPIDRNKKYDEIFNQLAAENVALFFPQVRYDFWINKDLKGIKTLLGNRPEDRYNTITNWYLGETRVKKP